MKIRSVSRRRIIKEIFESLNDNKKKRKLPNLVKIFIVITIASIIFGSTFGILVRNNMKVKEDIFNFLFLLVRLPANFRFQVTSSSDWRGAFGEGCDYCTEINKPAGSYNITITGDNAWGYFHKKSTTGYIEVALYVNNELVDYEITYSSNYEIHMDEDKPLTIIDMLVLFIAMDTEGKLGNTFKWGCWLYYTKPPL